MMTYLIQLTICWSLFYAAYYFLLRGETHFRYNRWYLLAALILGLILPLIGWESFFIHAPESLGHLYIAPLNSQMAEWDGAVYAAAPQTVSWGAIASVAYIMGALIAASQLIRGWLAILRIRRQSEVHARDGYELVLTKQDSLPFSFLRTVFCSREMYMKSPGIDQILTHEVYHIKAFHSLDVLFLEILKILFWFHPMVYVYKNELQQIHEYQADHAACRISTKKQYGKLLLNHVQPKMPMPLANHFFNSQLKNRFKMMTKKPSTRQTILKYLVILPMMGLAVFLFSFTSQDQPLISTSIMQQDTLIPPPPPPPPSPPAPKEEEIFRVVEEMPRFPGCEDMDGTPGEIKACADRKMLEFLYKNIRYPAIARDNGVEGNVVISVIVEKDGSLTNPKVIRDPGAGLGEEAVRIVEMMADLPEKWTPGVQRGHEVRVQFILPVKFELGTNKEEKVARNPLFVLNDEILGAVNMEDLNETIKPDDIESISVLKGETAIEKYGEKGRDGVVEITTKWHSSTTSAHLDVTNVKIYPVPAETLLNVEGHVSRNGSYRLEIRDLKGSVVREQKVSVQDGTLRTQLDVNGLAAGPYYVMILHGGKVFSKAFVKQ